MWPQHQQQQQRWLLSDLRWCFSPGPRPWQSARAKKKINLNHKKTDAITATHGQRDLHVLRADPWPPHVCAPRAYRQCTAARISQHLRTDAAEVDARDKNSISQTETLLFFLFSSCVDKDRLIKVGEKTWFILLGKHLESFSDCCDGNLRWTILVHKS